MGQEEPLYPRAVAAELRAQMARQQKSIAELADILGLERQAAKKRYDGDKEMTVSEVDRAAGWLGIDRQVLLQVEAVA
jgi:plasmid maintenance system antidote protein VapI